MTRFRRYIDLQTDQDLGSETASSPALQDHCRTHQVAEDHRIAFCFWRVTHGGCRLVYHFAPSIFELRNARTLDTSNNLLPRSCPCRRNDTPLISPSPSNT